MFGSHGQQGIDVQIPLRYQSDDGLCVIELRARTRPVAVRGDVTTFGEIADAAERIIEQCVRRVPAGGSTTDFSTFCTGHGLSFCTSLCVSRLFLPPLGTHWQDSCK